MPAFVTASRRAPSRRADRAAGAVPDDPRPQLGELVGRVAAGEHVEHVLELRAREVGERVGAARRARAARRRRSPRRRRSRRSAARARRAGCAGSASPRSRPRASRARRPRTRAGRRGTSGRCGPSRRRRSSWPARPIRCRPRATDFGDSTWITRSTAPMSMPSSSDEVATRHGIRPAFRSSSTITPLLARERAVVGARDLARSASSFSRSASRSARRRLLTKTIVERCASTSAQELGVDRRPDRLRAELRAGVHLLSVGRDRIRERRGRAELAHVLDRDDDLEVELLARAGVDELGSARPPRDEAADLLERPLRRREPDALQRLLARAARAARPRARGARRASCRRPRAPRRGSASRPPRSISRACRGQQQVERLGRRDQDVRRAP